MIRLEAILLIWGVRDEVLERLPVKGYWIYGEYDFIAKIDFDDEKELKEFSLMLTRLIGGGKFKIFPVKFSYSKEIETSGNVQREKHKGKDTFYVF